MDIASWLAAGVVALALFGVGYFIGVKRTRPSASHTVVPARARTVLRALPYALLVTESDGRVHFMNDKARELGVGLSTGFAAEPLRELASKAITHDERLEAVMSLRRRQALSDMQLLAIATPVPLERIAVISVFDAGSAAAARTAHRDFIVNVSHELKTPIGALLLMSDALEAAAEDPQTVRAFGRRIGQESERMKLLVDQFIELSRVQSTETVVDSKLMDVATCVTDAVDAVQALARSRIVAVDVAATNAACVSCDRRSMTMAIRNLIENAVRYSPEHSRVTVSTRVNADAVELSVKDQGIGIGAQDLPHVFDRFYRADSARDRDSGGSGIGLAIVKHVVRQHGGRVHVWSEPGVGSTFKIVLPLIDPKQ